MDFDIGKVKKVGILWDASFENDFQHLAALNRQLVRDGQERGGDWPGYPARACPTGLQGSPT
ncbi:MAG: hypothetical protein MZV63_23095 [Marinilabiliales bacterium]|nr:hypothetical protein [Marinilabiliales bacterium]